MQSLRMDIDYLDRMTARHREMTGWDLVGLWHVHVTDRANRAEPSRQDLATWTSWWTAGDEKPFAGLIVSRSISRHDPLPAEGALVPFTSEYDGWLNPTITAFVIDRGGAIRVADVEVERGSPLAGASFPTG